MKVSNFYDLFFDFFSTKKIKIMIPICTNHSPTTFSVVTR